MYLRLSDGNAYIFSRIEPLTRHLPALEVIATNPEYNQPELCIKQASRRGRRDLDENR